MSRSLHAKGARNPPKKKPPFKPRQKGVEVWGTTRIKKKGEKRKRATLRTEKNIHIKKKKSTGKTATHGKKGQKTFPQPMFCGKYRHALWGTWESLSPGAPKRTRSRKEKQMPPAQKPTKPSPEQVIGKINNNNLGVEKKRGNCFGT